MGADPRLSDALFDTIAAWHRGRPLTAALDAGTGPHSLAWLGTLGAPVTAVTTDTDMAARARGTPGARVVHGDWTDPGLLRGERFDLVLADYLLGAVDGFTPYFQDRLFERIRPHVADRLYAVGLQPWPDAASDADARAFLDLVRLRDAAFLVSGVRPYREYPDDWVHRTLSRSGFQVVEVRRFPILHSERTVDREWGNVTRTLRTHPNLTLARAMIARADALRATLHARVRREPLIFGSDWVIAAEPWTEGASVPNLSA